MVNADVSVAAWPTDGEAIAIAMTPEAARAPMAALFDLDQTLGQVLRTTREPMVGQMRLTWWHDALNRLDTTAAPAQPVLQALQAHVLAAGTPGERIATLIDGWEVLLETEMTDEALWQFAQRRGGRLFAIASDLLGAGAAAPIGAGEGWALADLSTNLSDPRARERAAALASEALTTAFAERWPAVVRPLGVLALLAGYDLADQKGASAAVRLGRAARVAWFRTSGR